MTNLNIGNKYQAIWKDGTTEDWELRGESGTKEEHLTLNLIILKSKDYDKGATIRYSKKEFLEGLKDGSIKPKD